SRVAGAGVAGAGVAGAGVAGASPAQDGGSEETVGASVVGRPEGDGTRDDSPEDEELAAYNRYLAELNATGRPKRW
ncbi:MAG: hypothetical protein ACRDY3_08030, partial [Acidimicrobiales bacterium]